MSYLSKHRVEIAIHVPHGETIKVHHHRNRFHDDAVASRLHKAQLREHLQLPNMKPNEGVRFNVLEATALITAQIFPNKKEEHGGSQLYIVMYIHEDKIRHSVLTS